MTQNVNFRKMHMKGFTFEMIQYCGALYHYQSL
jgi:hypothetical protein